MTSWRCTAPGDSSVLFAITNKKSTDMSLIGSQVPVPKVLGMKRVMSVDTRRQSSPERTPWKQHSRLNQRTTCAIAHAFLAEDAPGHTAARRRVSARAARRIAARIDAGVPDVARRAKRAALRCRIGAVANQHNAGC